MNPLLKKALSLLARRDYAEAELRQKLMQFGAAKHRFTSDDIWDESRQPSALDPAELDKVIEYCYRFNWLNDNDYAGKYIRARSEKGYGFRRIALELKQKGLSPSIISEVAQHNPINYPAHIVQILEKKFRHADRNDWTTRRKITQYLVTRGFSTDEIQQALNNDADEA